MGSEAEYEQQVREAKLRQLLTTVTVPTADADIKQLLRVMGHPACFFGEGPADRRHRLKTLIAERLLDGKELPDLRVFKDLAVLPAKPDSKLGVSAVGTDDLWTARVHIAKDSTRRAQERIALQKQMVEKPDVRGKVALLDRLGKLRLEGSQAGDEQRALSAVAFSSDARLLATGSWSGVVKLWEGDGGNSEIRSISGAHENRVTDVLFLDSDVLASCGGDGKIHLWNTSSIQTQGQDPVPASSLQGHRDRINRIIEHPTRKYLLSSSFDLTWRLWDIETNKALLVQSGHVRPIYALGVHPDGSLVISGDTGGGCRLWDLRTGRNIFDLKGHAKSVLGVSLAKDGVGVASCGEDNSIKLWDLRKRKLLETLAGHLEMVTDVHFFPGSCGTEALVSCSHDSTIKIWNSRTFDNIKTLKGHEDKISRIAVGLSLSSREVLASVSFDRTWKLWKSHSADALFMHVDG